MNYSISSKILHVLLASEYLSRTLHQQNKRLYHAKRSTSGNYWKWYKSRVRSVLLLAKKWKRRKNARYYRLLDEQKGKEVWMQSQGRQVLLFFLTKYTVKLLCHNCCRKISTQATPFSWRDTLADGWVLLITIEFSLIKPFRKGSFMQVRRDLHVL